MFSIIIPTWNNLEYLKLCIESIRKNSTYKHQIIVHINDGSDGTKDWIIENQIDFTWSAQNIGICYAVNQAAIHAKYDYIVYMNDDMYVCPEWDKHLTDELQAAESDCFMLSSTMIEPVKTSNTCVIVKDFGKDIQSFREKELLHQFKTLESRDWSGSTWPPTIVSKKYWFMVGGYSIELSPGMSSDDDFSMKMWKAGCRVFKGVGKSKVYHFQTKSTSRIKKNNGRKQFLFKWGINQSTFSKYFIKRGQPYIEQLTEPKSSEVKKEIFRARIKQKIWENLFRWESD